VTLACGLSPATIGTGHSPKEKKGEKKEKFEKNSKKSKNYQKLF